MLKKLDQLTMIHVRIFPLKHLCSLRSRGSGGFLLSDEFALGVERRPVNKISWNTECPPQIRIAHLLSLRILMSTASFAYALIKKTQKNSSNFGIFKCKISKKCVIVIISYTGRLVLRSTSKALLPSSSSFSRSASRNALTFPSISDSAYLL